MYITITIVVIAVMAAFAFSEWLEYKKAIRTPDAGQPPINNAHVAPGCEQFEEPRSNRAPQIGPKFPDEADAYTSPFVPRPRVMAAAQRVMKKHKATLDRLNDHATIRTSNGHTVKIDAEDLEYVKNLKWCFDGRKNSAAVRLLTPLGIGRTLKSVVLGTELDGHPKMPVIRHKNKDPLDCRKSNLKVIKRTKKPEGGTQREAEKTIDWVPEIGCFRVRHDGKLIGDYRTRNAAEAAYHKAYYASVEQGWLPS